MDTLRTVVIIEPSYLIAMEIARVLEEELGFKVCEIAVDENHAADAVSRHQPDLVTTDWLIDGKPSAAAIKRILKACPTARLIYIAASDFKLPEDAIVVMKPFATEELKAAIDKAFGSDARRQAS